MTKKPNVAIIGFGKIGQALATDFSKSSRHFITSANDLAKVQEDSKQFGALAEPLDTEAALIKADIVILAIPFGAVVPFLNDHAVALNGKIIVDPSNPFSMKDGKATKIIGEMESGGEINAAALPKGVRMAKALGTLGADNLSAYAYRSPEKATLFYATSETSINETIEQLINDLGFDALRVGDISQSARIEIEGDLHQVYALTNPVTLAEAKKLL